MSMKNKNSRVIFSMILITSVLLPAIISTVNASMLNGVLKITSIQESNFSNKMALQANVLENLTFNSRWKPQLAIDSNDKGIFMWTEQTTANTYNISYIKTNGNIYELGGWKSWSSTPTLVADNVVQELFKGFMSLDIDANGNLFVLFSNSTNLTSNPHSMDVLLWNSSSNSVSTIYSTTENWTMVNFASGTSIYLRPAGGKLLIDSTGVFHMLWNNGTALFYKEGSSAVQVIDSAGIIGYCDMALDSQDDAFIVYSKSDSSDAANKEIYYTTSADNFNSKNAIISNTLEDAYPSVAVDSSDNDSIHVVWTQRQASGDYLYVVKYTKIGSGVISSISTDIGEYEGNTVVNVDPIIAYSPQVKVSSYGMDIFYIDTTNFKENGVPQGEDADLVWQHYADPTDITDNVLTLMSAGTQSTMNDFFLDFASSKQDDIFISWLAYNASNTSQSRMRLSKIDYNTPALSIINQQLSGLNNGDAVTVAKPLSFDINFSIGESDIKSLSATWDGSVISGVGVGSSSLTINDVASLSLGKHVIVIRVTDEMNNQLEFTGTIKFSGIDLNAVLAIVISSAIGAGAVIFIFWLYKNRAKFARKK
ncbi:MAG: hypothetical protein ACTSVI_09180, partial [Promethearchaeota archaeon]